MTKKDEKYHEHPNRKAARTSLKKSRQEMDKELESGLESSFPASDPATATRPGAKAEDAKEGVRPKK